MNGPGKYDAEATELRESLEARGVALIVIGGRMGSGFSVQGPMDLVQAIPAMLRAAADEMENDLKPKGH